MDDTTNPDTLHWLIGALVAICIAMLIAWARNDAGDPGIQDRTPDPEDVLVVVVQPAG